MSSCASDVIARSQTSQASAPSAPGGEGTVGDEEGAGFRRADLGVGQSAGQRRLVGEVVLQAIKVEWRIVEGGVVSFIPGDFNLQSS